MVTSDALRYFPRRKLGVDDRRFPAFDFAVFIEGKSMREVAMFVSEKLSPIEGVLSTSTSFVLKTYKDNGIVIARPKKDERLELS